MMQKFNDHLLLKNENGLYLTALEHEGESIPSIADYLLMHEFLDYRYLKYNELDHIKWETTYPRIKIWHDAMMDSSNWNKNNLGFL